MKVLLALFFFTLSVHLSHAANYYFSSASGDDNRSAQVAQNSTTPWRTLDKFSAVSPGLKPGDSVFFKRGEMFYGTLKVQASGVSGNVIYFGAYGTGANPIITGFTTLSGWTLYTSGIYYANLDMPNLNMVTINGTARGQGRYPNTGYLKYEKSNGNLSITDNELTASPNWTGAEIVMRKYRFIMDRHTVTNHAGTVLNYSTSNTNGNNSAYLPVNENGYFFQNHLQTLDQFSEWYYDNNSKRLYVFFGANAPANYVVKASTKDYNATLSTLSYLTFENLGFEGANLTGLNLVNVSNTVVQNCNFYNEGGTSIYGIDLNTVAIKGGSINTSFSNGINFEYNDNNCTVDGVAVYNTNTIAGTGRSGNGVSIGITIVGNNTTITNNKVIGSGYSGIEFQGGNVLVEYNYVDTYCTIKDDGGGIYTYNGNSSSFPPSNRKIRNNIVLNAVGTMAGAGAYWWENFGKAAGIYLDQGSNGVEVSGNVVANGDWAGLFLHRVNKNIFSNNLIYNHRFQVHVTQDQAVTRNNTMTDNQYISKLAFQSTFFYRTYALDSPSKMGVSDRNYYARLTDDNSTIRMDNFWVGVTNTSYISLANWKTTYSLDPSSKKSPVVYASTSIDSNVRFEYNATNTIKIIHLNEGYTDVKNNTYAGDIGLEPFTGIVLLKTGGSYMLNQVITFPAVGDKNFGDASFLLNASTTSGLPVVYRVVSGPATVSGNKLTLTGVGKVTVEATQPGTKTYKTAKAVSQSFYVWPSKSQTISFAPIPTKKYGDPPFTLTATASSGLPVTFQIISGLATISGNSVTLKSASVATVIVEATQAGNSTYKPAAPVRQSFTVNKLNQSISFPQPADKYYGDGSFALTATASSGLPVTYQVTSGPATLTGNVVTITGTSTVWIAASQSGNDNYEWAPSVSQSFYVSKGAQSITFPPVADKTVGDAPFALNATASSGLPVRYRILSGPATIDSNLVTVTDAGEVWIEASQEGNDNYNMAASEGRNFFVKAQTSDVSPAKAMKSSRVISNQDTLGREGVHLLVFPNPVRNNGFIRVQSSSKTAGFLGIYDKNGKLVKHLGYRQFDKGTSAAIEVNLENLANGTYFIRFSSTKFSISGKLQKL